MASRLNFSSGQLANLLRVATTVSEARAIRSGASRAGGTGRDNKEYTNLIRLVRARNVTIAIGEVRAIRAIPLSRAGKAGGAGPNNEGEVIIRGFKAGGASKAGGAFGAGGA